MKSASASVAAALEAAVTAHPEASALSHGSTQISYRELWREVRQTARAFVAHRIGAGQRVASWSPATLESLCVQWAALLCGATLVHLDLELEVEHARAILDAEQPSHVFVRASFEGRQFPAILRAMRGELRSEPRVVVHGRTARFERVLPGGWAEFVDHAAAVSDDELREQEAVAMAHEHEKIVGICYGPQGSIEMVQPHHVLEAHAASAPSLCARTSLADASALHTALGALLRGRALTLAYAAGETTPRPAREPMRGGPRPIEA